MTLPRSLMPGNFVGGSADLEGLPRWNRSFVGLIAVCVAGSVAGAGLLLVTPERAFTVVVPLLIGLATILFAGAGRIQRWILSHAARSNGLRVSTDGLRLLLFLGGRLARVLPPNLIRGSSSPSARSSP